MKIRDRIAVVFVAILILAAGRIATETYLWYAHDDERARIVSLMDDLRAAGLEIVRSQLHADSLRRGIEALDDGLDHARRRISRYESRAVDGTLPSPTYNAYRGDLGAYNRRVGDRNARYSVWRETIDRNHTAVRRYNAVADSIRTLAESMGEPFYPLPTPAEIALERGIRPPAGP